MEHSFSVQDGYFITCHLKRNFCGAGNKDRSISEIDRERIDSQGEKSEISATSSVSGIQAESQNSTEENNAEEKTPSIASPRWEDENGKAIAKALVGDEVYLCADTENIAGGTSATVKVIEKDGDGNDDFVAELNTSVQDGKIRRKWKVVYTEDNDDTDSQKELEEKGYTLPEYTFTVESSGVKSEESGQLDVKSGIRFLLQNRRNGKLLKKIPYLILKNKEVIYKGRTDENGYAEVLDLEIGTYYIVAGKDMKKWLNKK